MAYTRIHAIKATVNRSIAYICNPEKTEGELYVSSYGCAPKTAHLEFAFANGKNPGKDSILAHHLIQSFSPGEVTFETAHQIGIELADKLPYMHFIAWDILITEEGHCIIEANTSSGVNIIQLWGGQRNKELGDFYRYHKVIK